MSDVLQYAEVLRKYHIDVYPKENCKGRGLCRRGEDVLEVQFALSRKNVDDYGRIEEIRQLCQRKNSEQQGKWEGEKLPYIPEEATFEGMYRDVFTEGMVWIGYDQKTAKKWHFQLEKAISS